MLSCLLINPLLRENSIQQVKYTLDPYTVASGPIRGIQKFTVILMTTQGTDKIRPWFGTRMPEVTLMNAVNKDGIKLFVKEQLESAIQQFFDIQKEESNYHSDSQDVYDIILTIEVVSIDITEDYRIDAKVKFTPATRDSILLSLEI